MAAKKYVGDSFRRFKRLFIAPRATTEPTTLSDGDMQVTGTVHTAKLRVAGAPAAGFYTAAEKPKFDCDGTNRPTCEGFRIQDSVTGTYMFYTSQSGVWTSSTTDV